MIRAHSLTDAAGDGPTVRLAFEERHRRRLTLRTTDGEAVLLDLDKATRLRGGQRIAMDDGRVLTVEALPEAVVDIV
ncbi:MAG: urease accessory protein UreE, partial [Pseudomonadota bacterium]